MLRDRTRQAEVKGEMRNNFIQNLLVILTISLKQLREYRLSALRGFILQ